EQAQQGGLAGAVGSDQADALAGAEVEGEVGEQRSGSEGLGEPLDAQQGGHARPRSRGGTGGGTAPRRPPVIARRTAAAGQGRLALVKPERPRKLTARSPRTMKPQSLTTSGGRERDSPRREGVRMGRLTNLRLA